MKNRTAKSVKMMFDYNKGVLNLDRLEKLAVPFTHIRAAKRVIRKVLNRGIQHTVISKYIWIILLLSIPIMILGMIYIPYPYNYITLGFGILVSLIPIFIIVAKKRQLKLLLKRTKRVISNETSQVLKGRSVYVYRVKLCRRNKCFAKMKYFEVKIRDNGKVKIPSIDNHILKDPSRVIPANPKIEPSVFYNKFAQFDTQAVNIVDKNSHHSGSGRKKSPIILTK